MSAIFGIVHFDGDPVERARLEDMKTAMDGWGPDGSGIWCQEMAGMGQLLLHNTPEAVYERLPMGSSDERFVVTAAARIDNRDELLDIFAVPRVERDSTPDGVLILKAYEKWGEDCPDHLLGDWAFAIWDQNLRRLFLARDHHGNTALYYYSGSSFFAFASSLKGLLAVPEIPRAPGEIRIAQLLTEWRGDSSLTCYRDVLRLPPAHCMTISERNPQVRRYWRLEEAPAVHLGSDQEYVEAFLGLYRQSVQCRLRSLRPVGVTLSGGLDSGSVALLAARELARTRQRLHALSSVPMYSISGLFSESVPNERPLIEATARAAGNIDVTFISAQGISPLEGIRHGLQCHDEPQPAAVSQYWLVEIVSSAARCGLGSLLTGQTGNATISWPGRAEIEEVRPSLLARGELWRAIKSHLIKPLLPTPLLMTYRSWRGTDRKTGLERDPWAKGSAINVHWAHELRLADLMTEAGFDPWYLGLTGLRERRHLIIGPGTSVVGAIWYALGASHSIDIRDPTADKRLMEFCLGVPNEQYTRDGKNRLLIRRAMAGILPDEVLWNSKRGRQSADIGYRVLASEEEIRDALATISGSPLCQHILDLPKMQAVLEALKNEVNDETTVDCANILLRGLMVGLFLLRFEGQSEA